MQKSESLRRFLAFPIDIPWNNPLGASEELSWFGESKPIAFWLDIQSLRTRQL